MSPSKNSEREAREVRERLRRYNARQSVHEASIARRKRDNWFAIGAIVVVAALATVAQLFYFNGGPGTPTPEPTPTAAPSDAPVTGQNVGDVPDPALAENRVWTGELALNDVVLGIQLDGSTAPQAVSSLIQDATTESLIGKSCHRLVAGASANLLQCGSLNGDGAPDPSYSFGPIENAPADKLYPAGTIAMARVGEDAFSNGRQFFVILNDTTLPGDTAGGYTVVGQVTSGLDALKTQITDAGVQGGEGDGAPVIPTTITRFTIQ